MTLRSLFHTFGGWFGARRQSLPGPSKVEPAPIILLTVLFLIGSYFVVSRINLLLSSSDLKLSPLEVAGVIVVATAAGLLYSRFVAWLDRNEKEPWPLMVSVLLLGAVAGFGIAHGAYRILRSDLERLLAEPPLNESELNVLFPDSPCQELEVDCNQLAGAGCFLVSDSPRQVLEIECNQPGKAVSVLCGLEQFDEVVWRMDTFDGPPCRDRMIFVVSEGIAGHMPFVRRELIQADIQCREPEPPYVSSRDFFEKGIWSDVRERLWDIFGPKRLAPLVEEAVKGLLVLLLFIGLVREFGGPLDGIVYGALIGLGFAMTENVVYMIDKNTQHQFITRIVLRGLSGHATYTAFTGLGLGIARTSQNRTVAGLSPVLGFGLAVVAHAVWNNLNSTFSTGWLNFICGVLVLNVPFVAMIALGLWLSWRQEDRAVREHLPADLYDPATYTALPDFASARARYDARQRAAHTIGRQKARLVLDLQRTLIEIAFCHWYAEREKLDSATMPELPELRRRVLDLRAQIVTKSELNATIKDSSA